MAFSETDRQFMNRALELADYAAGLDEVPVGAVVVLEGSIIGEGFNHKEQQTTALGHAELMAISQASKKLGRWRLMDCILYVTLEPCLMCAGAIQQARIKKLIYASKDPKGGAVSSLYEALSDKRLNHQTEVESGLMDDESSQRLKDFFKKKRATPSSHD